MNAIERRKDAAGLSETANCAETRLLTLELNQDEVIIGRAMPDQSLLGATRLIKAERTGPRCLPQPRGWQPGMGSFWQVLIGPPKEARHYVKSFGRCTSA
jgi:hypothetical protein